jgi:hypothetical protein
VLSAHYRVEAGRRYFLKLRRGGLADLPVAVPRLLAEQGVTQVVAPLLTRSGRLTAAGLVRRVGPQITWSGPYRVAVYTAARIQLMITVQ